MVRKKLQFFFMKNKTELQVYGNTINILSQYFTIIQKTFSQFFVVLSFILVTPSWLRHIVLIRKQLSPIIEL